MSRFHNFELSLRQKFEDRSLLKVICGLNNFDKASVARISKAAGIGGADLIDVACDPDLVKLSLEVSGLPICVSAVEPEKFPAALEAGASMVEIGNFDTFYASGRFFDANEVLDLTIRSRKIVKDIPLSVTVPHTLPLDEQAKLAQDLVDAGADVIQTEGGVLASPNKPGVVGLIEKAVPSLGAAYIISKTLAQVEYNIPLICASGLSEVTVSMAIASGASGVGVGSVINRLNNELEMIAMVRSLRDSIDSLKKNLQTTY